MEMKLFTKIRDYIRKLKAEKEKNSYIIYFYDEYQGKWYMDDTMRSLPDAQRMVETVTKDGIKAFYMHKSHAITHCLQ